MNLSRMEQFLDRRDLLRCKSSRHADRLSFAAAMVAVLSIAMVVTVALAVVGKYLAEH